jgi:diaminohydroxyphosphoribosylaminopyrimidine deaminase/5-amino-6-(5-phosphoribosylamino)uracil reductase
VDLAALLRRTAQEGWLDVMVEGGARLADALLAAGLVDRLRLFLAPILVGGPRTWLSDLGVDDISSAQRIGRLAVRSVGGGLLVTALLPHARRELRMLEKDPIVACSPD